MARAKQLDTLKSELEDIQGAVIAEAALRAPEIGATLPEHRVSAENLAHYLGLRKRDVHRLQLELGAISLSSLGRCEGHVLDTLRRILAWLDPAQDAARASPIDWWQAESLLHANTHALFGPKPTGRHVYIMVTAPDAADATDSWADSILTAGTDLLRINGAHQTPVEWRQIAERFRARAAKIGRSARIFVDLPGPKMRFDVHPRAPAVLHLPRQKDSAGRTLGPTSIWLVGQYQSGAQMPIPESWLPRLRAGDTLSLLDTGGRSRTLVVQQIGSGSIRAECCRSIYLTEGLEITWQRDETVVETGVVGALAQSLREQWVSEGDAFLLNSDGKSSDESLPALSCLEPALLQQVKAGATVILDDGKVTARVDSIERDGLRCKITHLAKSPLRLRSGKGIAFPDTELPRLPWSDQDRAALRFAMEVADGVEISFVNGPEDVRLVADQLRTSAKEGFGMVLKLETQQAMRRLPEILFEALRHRTVGLMIARGDLAVEMSFERLAEMQEEVLWFGEACHLPVIWATQVLETMTHSGLPTRAEITDAAMAMRAECVMLNKGKNVEDAVRMLADIIGKMEGHQYKKRSLYRPLRLALGYELDEAGRVKP